MTVKKVATIQRWIGLSTDTKPTTAPSGSTFFEYDTKLLYVTYDDGTNWVIKSIPYGLIFAGTCNSGMTASTTTIACADLAGYGTDYFNTQFYMQVIKNANSIGAAPDGEVRKITDYVTATGTFTTDAFSSNVQENDEIFVMHKSIMLILSELPSAGDWALADYDKFDVADADANNERWNSEYISGAAGGAADIDTTTSDKLYILAGYNVAGAERYAVSLNLPIYADFFRVTEDVTVTWGATAGATAKAVGVGLSAGAAWDANNYIVIERQKGTGVDRVQVRSNLNGAGEATTNATVTDDSVAFKIERLGQTWACFYSTIQAEEGLEDWIKVAEIEDPSNYMTNQVTFYQWAFNGSAGDATETAQGDFDNWYLWLGTGGGSQYIAGDYSSAWVASDIDGSVFERQEALQQAVQVTDAGTATGFEEDGTGGTLWESLVAVKGTFTTSSATVPADTGRTEASGYWDGCIIVPLSGSVVRQPRLIASFANTGGVFTIDADHPFTAATGTVDYVILHRQIPLVADTDSTTNTTSAHVVGSKADTADYTFDASASSLQRLVKGILGSRVIEEGTLTTSSATVPADTVLGGAYGNDYFNGQILIPLTGSAAFQPRLIVDFATTTGVMTIDGDHPFTAATGTVAYIIVTNEADLIPGTDSTNDQTMAQAVGAKADTADYTYNATTSSMQRLVKGILGSRIIGEGTFTTSSATVPADTSHSAKANDWFNGQILIPLTGDVAFQPRLIADFATTTGVFTVDSEHPFTAATGTVAYIVVANEADLVPAADSAANTTTAHVVGNKTDAIPAMNAAPANSSIISQLKAILERVGATPADPDDSVLTSLGQRDAAATNDDMSDIATTDVEAKLRLILNRLSTDAFTATIQGAARTAVDTMLGQLATYFSASGAAMALQINNNTARTNLEQAITDLASVLGANGTNVFDPTIQGAARTDLDAALNILASYLSASGAAMSIQINNNTARTNLEQVWEDFSAIFGADGTNVFNPTIQGSARTDLDTALNILASYFAATGAAMALQVNNNTARTNLEQALDDFFTVVGCNDTNVFDPSIGGATRTDMDAAFAALGTALGAEFDGSPDVYDTIVTGYDSSGISANANGSVLERLEDVGLSLADVDQMVIAEQDDFDVADADANNERWDVGYINGTEGGSADINTTTAGKLYVKVDPDASPTAAAYGVHLAQPLTTKYFSVVVDVDATFGTPSGSWATAGMRVGPTVYDSNNVVYIQRQNSSGGVFDRLAAGAIFGGANQGEVYYTTADAAVGFKIERADNVWRLYYSLAQSPNYAWVLLTQYEDASENMVPQQSVYLDAYSPGSADAETAQGDFDNFRVYENLRGVQQALTGDYVSAWVVNNFDGSLLEVLKAGLEQTTGGAYDPDTDSNEAISEELAKVPKSDGAVTWNGTALASINAEVDTALNTIVPASPTAGSINDVLSKVAGGNSFDKATDSLEMLSDKLGAFTGDGGVAQDDSVKASLDLAHTDIDAILADTGTDGVVVNSLTTAATRLIPNEQVIEVSITAAANAGDTTVATVTTQPCIIESIVLHADAAQTADMTSCGIFGGVGKVVTFISAATALQAQLDAADKQLGWTGAVRLGAGKTIVISLVGTGATAVDLTVTIKYRAAVNGGYLA